MTRPFRHAAAVALLLAAGAGCDLFTPRPPRGSFTPGPSTAADAGDCSVCGTAQTSAAVIYRVDAPASVKVGKDATFTIYAATGTDKAIICEVAQPAVNLPGWSVDAGAKAPKLKLGLAMKSVVRDEQRPCQGIDRAAPPRSVKATRSITFPAAGTYAIEVVGFDGSRPLGMQYQPGPDDPPAPPRPSVPPSIEVTP